MVQYRVSDLMCDHSADVVDAPLKVRQQRVVNHDPLRREEASDVRIRVAVEREATREAIRGNQRQSEIIRGNQRSSDATREAIQQAT